jgi:hypothetical protein
VTKHPIEVITSVERRRIANTSVRVIVSAVSAGQLIPSTTYSPRQKLRNGTIKLGRGRCVIVDSCGSRREAGHYSDRRSAGFRN